MNYTKIKEARYNKGPPLPFPDFWAHEPCRYVLVLLLFVPVVFQMRLKHGPAL